MKNFLRSTAILIFTFILSGCVMQINGSESQNSHSAFSSGWIRNQHGNDSVIVFVHGVIGNAYDTWFNDKTNSYWPKLITEDNDFAGTNIYAYEYNSPRIGSALSVSQLASEMKERLLNEGVLSHKNIFFIVHSMGGLVTRQFLLREREELENRIRMLYFLGTPTTGSPASTLASLFSFNQQFKNMTPATLDSYLSNIMIDWQASSQMRAIPSYCAYETQRIGTILVVPFESATNLCNRTLLPIQSDHIQISKPQDKNALQYIGFKNAFKKEKETETSPPILVNKQEIARKYIQPSFVADIALGQPSKQYFVVIKHLNEIPFRASWVICTRNNIVVSGVMLEKVALYPNPKIDFWKYNEDLQVEKIQNGYIELRFRWESIYAAELGYPSNLQGQVIKKYKLIDGVPYDYEE